MGLLSSHQFNWGNLFICLAISMGQFGYGYPSSIMATTFGQPAFLEYMNLVDSQGNLTSEANQLIGAMSGVYQAGGVFGIFICGWVSDKWGRKAGVIYCSILSIIGGAGIVASQNAAMFIGFRFVAGLGAWAFMAITPVYTSELAPAGLRGLFVGMNGLTIALSYCVAGYMGLAFFFAESPAVQWRTPLGIALLWPVLMIIITFLVPESPRWLLMQGKVEEARKIVMSIHHNKQDPEQEYAKTEFYQMRKQVDIDRELNPSWMEMFRRPSYRKRLALSCGYAFIGQSTAVLVINNYGPLLYKALGYDSKYQLILQCGYLTTSIPGNLIGALIMDRIGRKPLLLLGIIGCCICLIIEATVVATCASPIPIEPNAAALRLGVAALFCFLFIYAFGVDVAGFVYFSELFPNHIRGKGVTITIAVTALTNLVYLQASGTAFANIGWKYYLVFIVICVVGAVYLWFALVETKGIPLEEMAAIFGDEDDVAVYSSDLTIDHNTHDLVVRDHKDPDLTHVATNTTLARTATNTDTIAASYGASNTKV